MKHADGLLNIAFAGKRETHDLEKIAAPLRELFAAFDSNFQSHQFNFISGIADGADQIASEVFIKGEWKKKDSANEITMGAVIAFAKEDYLNTIDNKGNFETLYTLCNQKLQLDGKYVEGRKGKAQRLKAHRQQGNVLSRIADVLIAVVSADHETKVSLTMETVICCLHKGVPVILLNPNDTHFYFYKDIEAWVGGSEKSKKAPEVVINYANTLVKPKPANEEEISPHSRSSKSNLIFLLRKTVWNFYDLIFKGNKKLSYTVRENTKYQYCTDELSAFITIKRKHLSRYSRYCQLQYRGGYILNYFLALLAVMIAVISIVTYIYFKKFRVEPAWYWFILALGLIKLVLIIAIVENTKEINKKSYNRNAIDYRYASERMRVNYYLSLLGILKAPAPSLGNHTKRYLSGYAGEILYKQNIKALSKQPYDIKLSNSLLLEIIAYIKDDWFNSQNKYHDKEINKMVSMHHHLEKASTVVVNLLLAVVIAELPLIIFAHLAEHHKIEFFSDRISPVLMGLATLAPAIVTTLNSIKFQTEAKKLSFRSQLIKNEIEKPYLELTEIEKKLSNPDDGDFQGSYFMSVLTQIDCMAVIMTDEVAEWSMLYEKQVDDPG